MGGEQRKEGWREQKARLRNRLSGQLEGRMQVEDLELQEMIDSAVLEEGEQNYLPLRERLRLKKELFDSFRRLDILQELVEDPEITEIMVNGADCIFVERKGRISRLDQQFESSDQLEDLIQQIVSRVNRTVNIPRHTRQSSGGCSWCFLFFSVDRP